MRAKKSATMKPESPTVNPPVVEQLSPDFIRTYTNHVAVCETPWDFALDFNQVHFEKDATAVTKMMSIHLSPSLAVRLVQIMQGRIKAYEAKYGQIPMPLIVE